MSRHYQLSHRFIADDTPESMSSVHNDHEYGKKAYRGKKQKHGQYLAIRANNQFESQRERDREFYGEIYGWSNR